MTIHWSTRALERIVEAAEFSGFEGDRLDRFVSDLFGAAERLEDFPYSGRVVPEIGRDDIREVLHRPFRILYRVQADRVEILTVRHMRQPLDPEADDL